MIGGTNEVCSCGCAGPAYICRSCRTLFCHDCAKLIGTPSSCICKLCDSLCTDYKGFLDRQLFLVDQTSPYSIEDLKAALRFPLQQRSANLGLALVFGGLLFAVPYLGISRVGLFFAIAGLIPAIVAIGLLFSCNLRIISAVGSGRRESRNLLDASEMLADVGATAALSCAILIVVLVPFLLTLRFAANVSVVQWLGIGWMIFSYPLALMGAASTNSFWETINPLHGIELIQAHKTFYPKFFSFYLFISFVVGGLVILVLVKFLQSIAGSPLFTLLPMFVVLMMVLGSLVFYANLAIAYLIGRMQFKE